PRSTRLPSFLLPAPAHPRAPPPFPTRRSSDLAGPQLVDAGHQVRPHLFLEVLDLGGDRDADEGLVEQAVDIQRVGWLGGGGGNGDRKSTRLNSSHVKISYAVFCLKKKTKMNISPTPARRLCKLVDAELSTLSIDRLKHWITTDDIARLR